MSALRLGGAPRAERTNNVRLTARPLLFACNGLLLAQGPPANTMGITFGHDHFVPPVRNALSRVISVLSVAHSSRGHCPVQCASLQDASLILIDMAAHLIVQFAQPLHKWVKNEQLDFSLWRLGPQGVGLGGRAGCALNRVGGLR